MRNLRKKLKLKQSELAVFAGVSQETVARYERCKQVSLTTDARIGEALFRTLAKQNPEAVKNAVQPVLEAAEKLDRIAFLKPESEPPKQLEKLTGKNLKDFKPYAESAADMFRRAGNNFLSWTR